jgi:hypothetical protein
VDEVDEVDEVEEEEELRNNAGDSFALGAAALTVVRPFPPMCTRYVRRGGAREYGATSAANLLAPKTVPDDYAPRDDAEEMRLIFDY